MNKKAQGGPSIGVIIAIALGVLVLVLLVFGVSGGFGTLWEKVTQFGGTDNNIADVARGCEVACASNNVYDYCTKERTLNYGKVCTYDKSGEGVTAGDTISDCEDCKKISTGENIDNCKYSAKRKSSTCNGAETDLSISCGIDCP